MPRFNLGAAPLLDVATRPMASMLAGGLPLDSKLREPRNIDRLEWQLRLEPFVGRRVEFHGRLSLPVSLEFGSIALKTERSGPGRYWPAGAAGGTTGRTQGRCAGAFQLAT